MSDDEIYILTPLGLLGPDAAQNLARYMAGINKNGIVLDDGVLRFVTIETDPGMEEAAP